MTRLNLNLAAYLIAVGSAGWLSACEGDKKKSSFSGAGSCSDMSSNADSGTSEGAALDETKCPSHAPMAGEQPSGAAGRTSAAIPSTMAAGSSTDDFSVSLISPLVVGSGTEVSIEGKNFKESLTVVAFGLNPSGLLPKVRVDSDSKAKLTVPAIESFGNVSFTLAQGAASQKLGLLFNDGKNDYPIYTKDPKYICAGEHYYDAQGLLRVGERLCGAVDDAGGAAEVADCSYDGEVDCRATESFKAIDMTKLTASILKSGFTIAGVAGILNAAPADCAADGATACVAVTGFPAAASSNLAAKVMSGSTVAGIAGTAIAESHSLCSSDGQTDCVAVAAYKAVDMSKLTAGNIKTGVTILGVVGAYPSATYALNGADSTADLDLASFNAKIKSTSSFEWFDSSGTRYSNTGDADITAGNIASGVTVFGTTGSLSAGSNCTSDGQIGCLTTSTYKSAETASLTAWDIRAGKTVAGIGGNLEFHKNMANTALFNRTSGTGASAGLDVFDTIDDYNNNGTYPTENPSGWPQVTSGHWLRDAASDNGAGAGGSGIGNGVCDGTEECVYIDRLTGLYWARDDGTTRTWAGAISYCDALVYGGYSDWRLPVQKELMQAYNDIIWSQKSPSNLNIAAGPFYWSSSTVSGNTATAWYVYLSYGYVYSNDKTNFNSVLCVRP